MFSTGEISMEDFSPVWSPKCHKFRSLIVYKQLYQHWNRIILIIHLKLASTAIHTYLEFTIPDGQKSIKPESIAFVNLVSSYAVWQVSSISVF